jgi:hypothetical protein
MHSRCATAWSRTSGEVVTQLETALVLALESTRATLDLVSMVAASDGALILGSHIPGVRGSPLLSYPSCPWLSLPVFQRSFSQLSPLRPGLPAYSGSSGAGVNASNSPEPQP